MNGCRDSDQPRRIFATCRPRACPETAGRLSRCCGGGKLASLEHAAPEAPHLQSVFAWSGVAPALGILLANLTLPKREIRHEYYR